MPSKRHTFHRLLLQRIRDNIAKDQTMTQQTAPSSAPASKVKTVSTIVQYGEHMIETGKDPAGEGYFYSFSAPDGDAYDATGFLSEAAALDAAIRFIDDNAPTPSAPVLLGTVLEATGIAYPESRYTGTYTSPEGLQLLLQAIEVKVQGDLQVAADPEFTDEVEALGTVAYQEGHLQTVDINGRTYVVCLDPLLPLTLPLSAGAESMTQNTYSPCLLHVASRDELDAIVGELEGLFENQLESDGWRGGDYSPNASDYDGAREALREHMATVDSYPARGGSQLPHGRR